MKHKSGEIHAGHIDMLYSGMWLASYGLWSAVKDLLCRGIAIFISLSKYSYYRGMNWDVGDEAEDHLEYYFNNPSVEWWNNGSELEEEWYLQYIQEEESVGANDQL